jgi:hypothetical protein
MRKTAFFIFILMTFNIAITFGQEYETVLSSPDNWQKEIIPFPISFAPGIDFTGFEDLRFAPGWADKTGQEFWAYCFVWYIEKDSALSESKLTGYFTEYYDGLMGVDIKNAEDSAKSNQLDHTLCLFIKTGEGFKGKMRVYDSFFTKDYLILNIIVKESFCSEANKQVIRCDISPKPFDDKVWEIFDDVRLKVY